jgi:predicted permease
MTVVGVAAPEFRSSVVGWAPDLFLPFAMAPVITGHPLTDFGGSFYTTVQLQPGISPPQAEAQLRALMLQLAATDTARYNGRTVRLDGTRGVSAEARDGVAAGSAFLMAMVAMVLLIACANVANLLLGRAAARRTEMGVRLAIGASRGRLVRQLLTESLLLATIGTIVGFVISVAVTRILPAALPPEAGIDTAYFAPDGRVLAFTIVLCVATTLLFGAVPSLRAASPNLVGLLKGSASLTRKRRRGMLVAVQAAMCVLLLAVAALFLRGLASARGVDPGFRAEGVVDANIDLGLLPKGTDRKRLMSAILQDASSMNGVQSATLAAVVPLGGSNMETGFLAEGAVPDNRAGRQHIYFNIVAPKFFATLRTPILRGREFLDADRDGAPRVAVINESAARRLWPGADALGRRFHWGGESGPLLEVVGIAHDANYVMPGEAPKATIYVPFAQEDRDEMVLMVRTDADLSTMRRSIVDVVHRIAPELPPPGVVAMTDDMSITLLPVRAGAVLLGAFGLIALVLATAGIYGVASYSVASRGRELGVRAALGATRAMIMRMVLWESGRRVATGAVVGLALTIVAGSGLSKVLYGVRPLDPEVILAVSVLIALVAVVAALAPAVRAARVDPVVTMREE